MAKYSNVFSEASKRMKDFKNRGFIPDGSKNVWQDFINEVAAENRGEYYKGAYTKNAYQEAYGKNVEYFESETYQDLANSRLEDLVPIYREELWEIYQVGDFVEMTSRYHDGKNLDFSASDVHNIDSLDGLITHANKALNVEVWIYRNATGRKRLEESSMMETYQDDMQSELFRFIEEVSEQKMKFKY